MALLWWWSYNKITPLSNQKKDEIKKLTFWLIALFAQILSLQNYYIFYRAFRTDSKLRLLTKIVFNVLHLESLCKKIWQKLQIRGSSDLLNSAISNTFFQFLTILCSKNAFNWFWSTKFAYKSKKFSSKISKSTFIGLLNVILIHFFFFYDIEKLVMLWKSRRIFKCQYFYLFAIVRVFQKQTYNSNY